MATFDQLVEQIKTVILISKEIAEPPLKKWWLLYPKKSARGK
ncbi:hypothetical protein ACW185_01900 [Limosilactobacillus fermentum]